MAASPDVLSGVHRRYAFKTSPSALTTPDGSTNTFKYDPFGRRIQKSLTTGAIPPTTRATYVYSGDDTVGETDQNGNVLAKYARTMNIDEPLAESRSGTNSYYEQDGLGSVTSMTNAAGALAQTYTFDSFGKQTASSGSLTNSFQYTGREFDSQTGLYYYRARYYDPSTGRFLSEDPIGFGGGVDFYSYVLNGPTQFTDAMGLSAQDVQRIQAACKKCTKGLTDAGLRANTTGALGGHWNDLTHWFTKHEGCKDQAYQVQPCLEANPFQPYDDKWAFDVAWWPVNNHIVKAADSNPNDPIVYCDPWRNYTWTAPKPRGGATGNW